MIAYHIDRGRKLHVGDILSLFPTSSFNGPYQLQYIQGLFGDSGVSNFGRIYTRDNGGNIHQPFQWFTETIFEYVRRLHFPGMPSRFQSFFAVSTIEDARNWIVCMDSPTDAPYVWEVEIADPIALDATWRDMTHLVDGETSFDPAFSYLNAINYWAGVRSDSPRLELVAQLPVRILRRVEY